MGGLSQAELDALCSHEDCDSEPSSPMGSMLLVRKRWRQRHGQSQTERSLRSEMSQLKGVESEGGGLSQAELDGLSVEEESMKDLYAGSPLGSALRCIKNRRRTEELPLAAVAEQEEQTSFTPLPCPASWGGSVGGISQAELDAMCDEHCIAEDIETNEVPKSPVSTAQSGRRRRGRESLGKSSPLRPSRAHKVDAENFGGKEVTLSVSPTKALESVSPGSPQRRHFASPLGRSPLSPALLN
jgi:hypothetical protein